MNDFEKHLDEQLKDPEFAPEWERQCPEREYIKAIIAVRMRQDLPSYDFLPRDRRQS